MTLQELRALAPAKVNLFLHVGPVQANGRHPLDSLVVFSGPEISDTLSIRISSRLSLTMSRPDHDETGSGHDQTGPIEDNLILRAARALQAETGTDQGAAFTLEKRLPVAAGIGGGSADAAAALTLLVGLWGVDPAAARAVAPGLGGDVPVALAGHASLMQGEGERVRRVTGLPRLPAILVNPGAACPTGPVFRAYDAVGGGAGFRELEQVPAFGSAAELIGWLGRQRNDLEAPAISLVPEIGTVLSDLQALPEARLARMSGSGATCFALFETEAAAVRGTSLLSEAHPDWWVRATTLGDAA